MMSCEKRTTQYANEKLSHFNKSSGRRNDKPGRRNDASANNQRECPAFSPSGKKSVHGDRFPSDDTITYREASVYRCLVKLPKMKIGNKEIN